MLRERNMRATANLAAPRSRRGFLLMVIIGVLAVLLAMCVGFLSFCRSEVNAVATVRDKNDSMDVMFSAMDWTLGNIGAYSFNGGTNFDANKYVAFTQDAGGGQWWYRPYEKGLKDAIPNWIPSMANMKLKVYRWDNTIDYPGAVPACIDPNRRDEAAWVYLPENYFPEGGVMGRFMVQVVDPNSVICLNDWLDDCCPTQTQVAHMIRDSYGPQQLERYYAFRDTGNAGASGWDRQIKLAPIRYQDAWRVATRTLRQPQYPFSYRQNGEQPIREVSPNGVTTNSAYMSPFGAEMILRASISADGVFTEKYNINFTAGPQQYLPPTPNEGRPGPEVATALPWTTVFTKFQAPGKGSDYGWNGDTKWSAGQLPTGMAYSVFAYEDPDTGRCPLNVNTCYNSGERLPMNMFGGVPSHSLEGVFNVDSLRMIIQISAFQFTDAAGGIHTLNGCNPADPNFINASLSNAADRQQAWIKHEQLRTKLAYQYQEKLCRYFTGTYFAKRSTFQRKWPPQNVNPTDNSGFTVGTASTDYSGVRFPMGLGAFRTKVRGALAAASTGAPTVAFDATDTPNVSKDQLDARTANAVFDNIVPGKPGMNGMPAWPDATGGDPISELFSYRLAREEYSDDPFESATNGSVYGYHHDSQLIDSGAHGPAWAGGAWNSTRIGSTIANANVKAAGFWRGLSLLPKGKAIAANSAPEGPWDRLGALDPHLPTGADTNVATETGIEKVPYRQWMFGPDWFSTELTTTTTTYLLVINAQIVDKKSVIENADKPVVISHFQFGVAAEVCPDVQVEGNTSGADWPTGAAGKLDSASINLGSCGLGYYRGGNPRVRKTFGGRTAYNDFLDSTKIHSMDYKCGSLATTYIGYREVQSRAAPIQNTSIPKEWKADVRGVPESGESSFYTGTKQVTRRIQIRGIWSMDNSLSR